MGSPDVNDDDDDGDDDAGESVCLAQVSCVVVNWRKQLSPKRGGAFRNGTVGDHRERKT